MSDPRLGQYREAALSMKVGVFSFELPVTPSDEVGRLGEALVDLATTLERKFAELSTLTHLTERAGAGLLLDEVLNHVYDSFHSVLPYDRIGFSLLEDAGRTVRAHWARSRAPELKLSKGYSQPLQGSSLELIATTGQPRILNDLEAYLATHPGSESTQLVFAEGVRSSLTCPLVAAGKPIGFLFFSSFSPNTYAKAHVDLFVQIAGKLAVIVEKSRLYQALLELNQTKDTLLGIVAHDLRNPISVVSGYAQLLANETFGATTTEQKQVLELIRNACGRMIRLVNDLVDLSAVETGHLHLHFEPVDTAAWLQCVVDTNRLLAKEKSIAINLDIEGPLPELKLDPARMEQVFSNLLTNAIKYSYAGTTITVCARVAADFLEVSVTDQGQGIPAGELTKLFSAFGRASVKPTGGESSTGLGLAISRRMVEAHGGCIRVQSEVGRGSTFKFDVPLRQA